jgi:hypothetical protein
MISAKQSQFGTGRARTPNPRSGRGRAPRGDDYAKQSQTWAGWGIWGPGGSPSPLRPPARPRSIVRNEPNFRRGGPLELADRAKQTQFGGVKCAKRTQFATTAQGLAGLIVRNKANFPPGRSPAGACHAKQSQFASGARKTIAKASGLDAGAPKRHSSRLGTPAARRTIAGPIVQNEPNFRRCRVGRGPRAVGHGANVQNEPNLAGRRRFRRAKCAKRTQFPAAEVPTVPIFHCSSLPIRRRSCETKPIPAGSDGTGRGLGDEGRTCQTNPIWLARCRSGGRNAQNEPNLPGRLGARRWKCAKRTQFPPVRRTRWTWNPPPYAGPTPRVRPQDNPVAWTAVVE